MKQLDALKNKKLMGGAEFIPADGHKGLIGSLYNHETDLITKKKNRRDENGKVIISPRNVVNNPYDRSIIKFREHIPDPYVRKVELARVLYNFNPYPYLNPNLNPKPLERKRIP